ncbi:hypothetical protein Esti_003784 [Eimeria stiedai]
MRWQTITAHGTLAFFMWVSVIPSGSNVTAFRSPVFLWAAANKPQSFFALSPHTQDFQEHKSLLLGIPEALSSPAVSLLQVEAGGEKDESEAEAKSSGSGPAASESSQSQDQESSSEAVIGSEEEQGGEASQEGSRAERTSGTAGTGRNSSKRETSSAEDYSGESSQEGSSEQVKPSPAEEAPKIKASGQLSSKSAPVHGVEAAASAAEAASEEESRSKITPPGASHKLTTESHVEIPKGERSTHVSTHGLEETGGAEVSKPNVPPATKTVVQLNFRRSEITPPGASHKLTTESHVEIPKGERSTHVSTHGLEEIGGAEVSKPNVPPATKTIVQLNFRPSMVIGSGEGDMVDRHVITEAGGTKWYQVVGKKELTILKLKPADDEQILHQASVTEQPQQY